LFFKVKTSEEVFQIIEQFGPLGDEAAPLEKAFGRILSRDIISPEDLPGFYRSTMDGYAVRAKDTFGATESLPALLTVKGEVIMGQVPTEGVEPGQAVKISTGGMLPEGADGVVMVEYSHVLDEDTIEVSRAISPLEHVILPDDDFKKGSSVLEKGSLLRPQDLGVMAGIGLSQVFVYRRPRVAIISTGDEVVPVDQRPEPGQVRDINTYTLSAFCWQSGAEPQALGLCKDDFEELKARLEKGLREADTVWISGGIPGPLREEMEAELSRNIESASGREDYIRVRLVEKEGKFIADPIFGKSGLISTLVEADGLIRVERNTEGLYEGERVKVMFITPQKGGFR
jgi:molybdopterin molybdotransferase